MFSHKIEHNVAMSKVITRYLQYIEELYKIVEEYADHKKTDKEQLKRIQQKYKQYKQERGAEIKKIFYITREEERFPYREYTAVIQAFEGGTTTFDLRTKTLIKEGESKTKQALRKKGL